MNTAQNKGAYRAAYVMPKADGFSRQGGAVESRFGERHFTVAEVGEMWTLSTDVVRSLFEREPGVLVLGDKRSRGKRRYTTLRIPQTVVERVHRRLCIPDLTSARARA